MRKKILIICDMFPPAFAPRMGYLCKYLSSLGWDATVVTEYIPDNTFAFLAGNVDTTYIHYYKASGKITKRLEWFWVMLLDVLFHYKDRKMIKACTRLIETNKYSGILCSTYRTFPLPVAQKLSQKYGLPFIADMRDIIEQYTSDEYISHKFHTFPLLDKWITNAIRHKLLKDRNKVLKTADIITTVSPWHVKMLEAYNQNVRLIYNGFDPELFYPQNIPSDRFYITYTGRVVSLTLQNPQLLFEAISELSEKQIITPETVRVQWFTNPASRELVKQLAQELKVDDYMDFHDYVPASEIPRILNRSSVVLSLTNKSDTKGPKGILGTKFFESLAVGKPILSVRSDESYLAETIEETHAGLAATNVDDVCRFLEYHYKEWLEKGYTSSTTDRNKIQYFSRKEQAKQFVRLFEEF